MMNGETETDETTFFLSPEIDTGNIILQREEPIFPDDDAGTLHDRLMVSGADLVLETVRAIEKSDYTLKKQENVPDMKLAPKITREMCEIDWNKTQNEIYNFVRGLSPYPAAWIQIKDRNYKIFRVTPREKTREMTTGVYRTDNRSFLDFQCNDGLVRVEEWQPEGKRRMILSDFFRGNSI
jgi:methionyl-tRNA formyltransferase